MDEPLSIKEAFQTMSVPDMSIWEGVVLSVSPMQIQAKDDEKLIIREASIRVPRHLTDYELTGQIISNTGFVSGSGTVSSGSVSVSMSTGEHSGHDLGATGSHTHTISSINLSGAQVTVNGAQITMDHIEISLSDSLNVGDEVLVLSYNKGKRNYILDRV